MEPSLLAAVIDCPTDDWSRLVAADWLEEQGQADRAEFIRVQVQLARPECCAGAGDGRHCATDCNDLELRQREQELLTAHGADWMDAEFPPHKDGLVWWIDNLLDDHDAARRVTFRRGFVAEVSCSARDWLTHGPVLVACQPLERVTLTDRHAARDQSPGPGAKTVYRWFFRLHRWQNGTLTAWDVPPQFAQALGLSGRGFLTFNSEGAAADWLSLAALTWARDSQSAQCPACGGDGIREVDTGGNVWQSPCPGCAGTGRRGGRTTDVSRPEQSAARAPSS